MTPEPSPSNPNSSTARPSSDNGAIAPTKPWLNIEPDDEFPMTPQRGSVDELQSVGYAEPGGGRRKPFDNTTQPPIALVFLTAIALGITSLIFDLAWMGITAAIVLLILTGRVLWLDIRAALNELLSARQRVTLLAIIGLVVAIISLLRFTGAGQALGTWYLSLSWDAIGATGEVIGAVGQILIAVLAVYVAWRQYIISRDLTIQQNLITQQQTIDSFFQGISELVLDDEGLLEDWPQERAIAEARTASILSSVDAVGKAKVLRFLSRSKLLTPLKRDRLLGRAILDGSGGYEEDRDDGMRVIDLGIILTGVNLEGTDLRWVDLSEANLIRANLRHCDLVKANLARTILVDADLSGADLQGVRLFYGTLEQATPRSRSTFPNYTTGEYTGAVVEGVDFTDAKRMSEEQRRYCCAWCGSKTRETIPGGCEGIPNRLGR
ncbi:MULTISPECIES: pentapeptide repeat-containing protein [unclassified Leptolyngbya]|uniref:pentapeptide repeat-containing protein n=1 Tax=unclassified Leptolyngbya TaxID=2650499 RepID=UPI00168A02B7|nr:MULTISPECIES: pentapeptide repeat-containing protein [unclassified Leptolyngbya]MBD1912490.1 pentapeptide repeat-containing protein [Leptolyngbya sp. FACHB-8]MBD2156499.1 pentapeptide repeat-containing protein [Leptolyngbya sp. FACHB-16]